MKSLLSTFRFYVRVGRKPSEPDSIKFKISSKTSRGKKDSTKDTVIDITSDSQVNSNFLYRWSPASLTFNNYFYLFVYLYITRITIITTRRILNHQRTKTEEPPWDGQQ